MYNKFRIVFAIALCLFIGTVKEFQTSPTTAAQQNGPLLISEFMASNGSSLLDEDGDSSDWIEIHNSSTNTVSLQGYYLTDDSAEMNQWAFPNMTLDAGEHLVVFASKKERAVAGSELHTNFKLSAGSEYLALSDGGTAIESAFSPTYPQQFEDVSFGIDSNGDQVYFSEPSPNSNNGSGIFPYAAVPPTASVVRGFYSTAQSVTLTAETNATIYYTTDGSEPTASNGTVYGGPLTIDSTTTLRAISVLAGSNPSTVETFSYIFLDDVISQGTPAGWPTDSVNGQLLDFGMDPNVVSGQEAAVKQSLQSLPSVSIVTDSGNLFDPATGIYVNAEERGSEWERPTSIEWLNADNTEGFQIDAGLRIRGGYSRRDDNPKHAFRFYFDGDYDGSLKYPIFGEEGVDTFKKLDLRTAQNYSWAFFGDYRNTFLREVWSRDTQAAMNNPYTRSNYIHLYVNGQYWGISMTQERVSEEYAEDYFGGNEDDYDVVKHYRNKSNESWEFSGKHYVTAGNDAGWVALWQLAQDQNISDAEYQQIEAQVDLDSLIDNQLIHMYSGDGDSVMSNFRQDKRSNNWYALRDRTGDSTKWRFFAHDAEHSLGSRFHDVNIDRLGPFPVLGDNEYYSFEYFNPQWLHQALTSNEKYRELFRYRAWQHLMEPGGALTSTEARARWDVRKAQVGSAILAASARWGDAKIEPPRGVSEWQAEVNWVENNWFPVRTGIVLAQLQAQNLAPTSAPAPPAIPAPPAAKMILNEYNAVDSAELLQENGSDSTFGQVLGNGGDWFELVTVADNLDIRGWTLEIWDADNFAKIPRRTDVFKLADQALLENLQSGTIVTVAEDVVDDPSYNPAGGDWVINLQANKDDDGAYFTPDTQSNFDTNSKNWQLVIRDAAGNLVFGPAGEGIGTLGSGVGNKEIGKLEADPATAITVNSAYNDGVSSTFGAPNSWSAGTTIQDFTALRGVVPTPTPTNTPTNTPLPTSTTVPTNTPINTPTPTNTTIPTNTPIPTNTMVPTNTPVATSTPIVEPTATPQSGSICNVYSSSDVPKGLPVGSTTASSQLSIADDLTITDVTVSLNMDHEWVGDMTINLVHAGSGTSATLLDRPGQPGSNWGCQRDDIVATFSDDGSDNAENQCVDTAPTINGTFKPMNSLTAFEGESSSGTWQLSLADAYASADSGTLNSWSVEICGLPAVVAPNTPTPTNTPTATFTPTPTDTPTPGNTPVGPTATPTHTATPTATATSTFTPMPTNTPTPIPTNTLVPTATPTTQPSSYFEDDFESATGWTENPSGSDTATTGKWERGNPQQTSYSSTTFQLDQTANGSNALVTGPLAGNSAGKHDIDNGTTSIRSPQITIPSNSSVMLSFSAYFSHWSNGNADDFLRVKVVGNTTQTVFNVTGNGQRKSAVWTPHTVNLDTFAGQSIYLLIEAADGGTPSLVEAAIDDVRIANTVINNAAFELSPPRDNIVPETLTEQLYLPLMQVGPIDSASEPQ